VMSRTRLTCKMPKLKSINRSPLKKTKFLGQWVTFSSEISNASFFWRCLGYASTNFITTASCHQDKEKFGARDIRLWDLFKLKLTSARLLIVLLLGRSRTSLKSSLMSFWMLGIVSVLQELFNCRTDEDGQTSVSAPRLKISSKRLLS
jgi:hypothetical protein